jgi:plastocyanin
MGSTPLPVGAALSLLAVAAVLVGCGGGSEGTDRTSSAAGSSGQEAAAVTIADYEYAPAKLTIPVGTTVTFSNRDSTPHTATSKRQGAFESGSIDTGKSAKVTLDETGTFAYYCLFHPFMKGTIVVE